MPLKLTIKKGETMIIGDNIEVFCTSTTDKQASFSVTAPRSVEITRLMADGTAPSKNSERGQSLSPEQQRNLALNKLNRGNRK